MGDVAIEEMGFLLQPISRFPALEEEFIRYTVTACGNEREQAAVRAESVRTIL